MFQVNRCCPMVLAGCVDGCVVKATGVIATTATSKTHVAAAPTSKLGSPGLSDRVRSISRGKGRLYEEKPMIIAVAGFSVPIHMICRHDVKNETLPQRQESLVQVCEYALRHDHALYNTMTKMPHQFSLIGGHCSFEWGKWCSSEVVLSESP
jgi:hypothetical protein